MYYLFLKSHPGFPNHIQLCAGKDGDYPILILRKTNKLVDAFGGENLHDAIDNPKKALAIIDTWDVVPQEGEAVLVFKSSGADLSVYLDNTLLGVTECTVAKRWMPQVVTQVTQYKEGDYVASIVTIGERDSGEVAFGVYGSDLFILAKDGAAYSLMSHILGAEECDADVLNNLHLDICDLREKASKVPNPMTPLGRVSATDPFVVPGVIYYDPDNVDAELSMSVVHFDYSGLVRLEVDGEAFAYTSLTPNTITMAAVEALAEDRTVGVTLMIDYENLPFDGDFSGVAVEVYAGEVEDGDADEEDDDLDDDWV